ncbi:MAG: hypothetical protein U0L38_07020 [Bacteroidales bacterium]|nr:hypothetical protein [Bacteroidales bacterium]
MEAINRIKVVLVEKNTPTNGWPSNWGKPINCFKMVYKLIATRPQ